MNEEIILSSINGSFDVIKLRNKFKEVDNYLIYKYQLEDKEDYIVVGKVTDLDFLDYIKKFIFKLNSCLNKVNSEELNTKNYSNHLIEIELLRSMAGFDKILYTQEGYDFLTGKNLFTQNNTIARTIIIEDYGIEKTEYYDNFYHLNSENKISTLDHELGEVNIKYFDKWNQYNTFYFLNDLDITSLDYDKAKIYVGGNYNRLVTYYKKYLPNWTKKHWSEGKIDNDEHLEFLVQLLEVLCNFQKIEGLQGRK